MIYLIAILGFLIRLLPRLILPNVYVYDTYYHLYSARIIRENRFRVPRETPHTVHRVPHSYPFLYHWLLAWFPLKYRLWVERSTGAFFDTCALLAVYYFSSWIAQASPNSTPVSPLWVAILFAFSPAQLRISSGPRAYNGSPRVFGQTLFLFHILCAYLTLTTGNIFAGIGCLLSGAAVILAAKFGTQVLVFFGMVLGCFFSPFYFLLWIGSFLTALILSGGRAWAIVSGQIQHSIFYCKHLQQIFLYRHIRTLWNYAGSLYYHVWKGIRERDYLRGLHWYYSETHILHQILTVFPQFLLIPFFLPRFSSLNLFSHFCFVWCAAAIFCFVTTKTKLFRFLGEGERYLEYALFPSLWLGVQLLQERYLWLIQLYLLYSLLSAGYYVWNYIRLYRKNHEAYPRLLKIYHELNQQTPGVILPIGHFDHQALYLSDFPVIHMGTNFSEKFLEPFQLVCDNYPYPSKRWNEILEKCEVKYILGDARSIDHYTHEILDHASDFFDATELILESEDLKVYRVRESRL